MPQTRVGLKGGVLGDPSKAVLCLAPRPDPMERPLDLRIHFIRLGWYHRASDGIKRGGQRIAARSLKAETASAAQ